jgi:protein-L-isoaspartate(D-aspartate) O-methyltransferase
MVADQLRARGIGDERVLAAMAAVPREAFLEPEAQGAAYRDAAIAIPEGQTMSQPWVVARMTELLRIVPGDRVLEIGTGSGYQAAILGTLGARVRSIERHPRLADAARQRLVEQGIRDVDVEVGDGSGGAPDGAPWDGIIVTAAAPIVPPSLPGQLAIGGRLVIPVGPRGSQELLAIERRGPQEWFTESDGAVVFVPLIGAEGFGVEA